MWILSALVGRLGVPRVAPTYLLVRPDTNLSPSLLRPASRSLVQHPSKLHTVHWLREYLKDSQSARIFTEGEQIPLGFLIPSDPRVCQTL
jgi:hypothetical protein